MNSLRTLQRRFGGARAWVCIAACSAGLAAQSASAQTSGPEPMPTTGVTLGSLVQRGSGTQNGIIIGDKIFYNFSYTGAPLPPASATNPNPAPTADQITVGQAPTGTNGPIGLSFSSSWLSSNGQGVDSVISYCVHTIDAATQFYIDGVGLHFNGATPLPGTDNGLTSASVTETVYAVNADGSRGATIGNLSTYSDGTGPKTDTFDSFTALPAPLRDICVTKDIQLHSSIRSAGGGVATISIVDNTFHQVPEPAALGLVVIGLPLLMRRRGA